MEKNIDIIEYIMKMARMSKRQQVKDGCRNHAPHGVFRVMRVLADKGTLQSSELADSLDIRAASLSETLAKMEYMDLIKREKDMTDSRIVNVSLSEKGKNVLNEGRERHAKRREKLGLVLKEDEKVQFAAICEKIIAALKAESEEGECENAESCNEHEHKGILGDDHHCCHKKGDE